MDKNKKRDVRGESINKRSCVTHYMQDAQFQFFFAKLWKGRREIERTAIGRREIGGVKGWFIT